MQADECVRLYDSNGEHKLSLLACSLDYDGRVACVDFADPDGKVLYCGVPLDLVETFSEIFGAEKIGIEALQ